MAPDVARILSRRSLLKRTAALTAAGAVLQPAAAQAATLTDNLIRYVSPAGSDTADGLTPTTPYATIAHAYTALITAATANYTAVNGELGVGRINLLPGDHDIAGGLLMDYKYPVELIGQRSGRHSQYMMNSAARIKSSSATATYFFRMHGTNVGYGWVFRDISFVVDQTVNTSLVSIINPDSIDDFVVENCSFDTVDNVTNLSVWCIKHENTIAPPTGDAAWFRIRYNRYSRMPLYYSVSGGNYNRFRIHDNVGFYGGSLPHVRLAGSCNGGLVDGNNFEGTATAVEIGPTGTLTQCTFLNNSGEDSSTPPTNPFYDFTGSISQVIILGGVCSVAGGTGAAGIFARFGTSAYNNLVIGPYDTNGVAGYKRKIVDNSASNGNRLINLNSGPVLKTKKVAGAATISDADFAPAPIDGTIALAVNTATGATALWARANGVWKSTTLA